MFTKPKKEELVSFYLQRENIITFFPRIRERTQRGGRIVSVLNPLFPRYLFVKVDLTLHIFNKIRWMNGVKQILGNGDSPTPINDEIIEFLREQTSNEGIIRQYVRFKEGDKVRIKYGPLKDLIGIIKNPSSKGGRIKVLMDVIRKSAEIEVDEFMLVVA